MVRTLFAALGAAFYLGLGALGGAHADGRDPRDTPVPAGPPPAIPDAAPQGRTGEILLRDGAVKLAVPTGYYFLPASDAQAYLRRIDKPAPAGETLGMIAPAARRPTEPNFWGAVVSYNPMGYVAPQNEQRLASPDLVAERRATLPPGAPPLEAFSDRPDWQRTSATVAWAERSATNTPSARGLREEVRLLGREGVVGATIDGRPDQATEIDAAAKEVGRMLGFTTGKGYASYSPNVDPAPVYDLPGVITLKPAQTIAPPPVTAAGQAATGPQTIAAEPAESPMAGLMAWLPWVIGILIVLGLTPWVIGLFRREKEPEVVVAQPSEAQTAPPPAASDPNLTPKT